MTGQIKGWLQVGTENVFSVDEFERMMKRIPERRNDFKPLRLDLPYSSPLAYDRVTVSRAMVERALNEYYGQFWNDRGPIGIDRPTKMRAALTAALVPAEQHPDDLAVDRFAAAMKAKLAKKRAEGRGGWERKDECSAEFLSRLLREHVEKGDPLDVGNLAMMLHQRGETVAPTPGGDNRAVAWLMESDGAEPILTHDPANAEYGKVQGWNVRALVPLSQLQAVERERDAAWSARNENAKLKGQRDAALARIKQMQDSNSRMAEGWSALTTRAETAEASLVGAERKGIERAAEVVKSLIPSIPIDGPVDQRQEVEYSALGHAWTAIRAIAGSNGE